MTLSVNIQKVLKSLYNSIKRFPVTLVFTAVIAITLIIMDKYSSTIARETMDILQRLLLSIALGIPFSLCIKLFFENYIKNHRTLFLTFSNLIMFIFLAAHYFLWIPEFNMVTITRYTGISLALYLAFFFVPYLKDKPGFEKYVIRILSGAFITVVFSGVLFGGISGIILTLDKLLNVPVKSSIYLYIFLLIAGFFTPAHFLGNIPRVGENSVEYPYSKAIKILILYIVMPLLVAYLAILYIYLARILITLQWPVGLVSHLVLWFTVVAAAVMFFVSPIYEETKWGRIFIFWFSKLVLPVMIMMFAAVYIRVSAFGWTENRYYVVALSIWVFVTMILKNFHKNKHNVLIPIILAVFALISVIGPFNSYEVARASQKARLESILISNDMLRDNVLSKAPADITKEDKTEISRIIDYFRLNHDFSDFEYVSQDFELDDMNAVFGFDYFSEYYYENTMKYFGYSVNEMSQPIDIENFDYLLDYRMYYMLNNVISQDDMSFSYDMDRHIFKISDSDKTLYEKDISEYGNALIKKFPAGARESLDMDDTIFTDETDRFVVRYIFLHIYGETENDISKINSAEFYVLVKVK